MNKPDKKRLRDPVYGYVDIPTEYTDNIIDTAPFQRLRRIIQTSYAPLYPSSVHNRFVHSIGVYHLGSLASSQLTEELLKQKISITSNFKNDLENYKQTFELACLLHDVGHAPFSHTGEDFFLSEAKDYTELHNLLLDVIGTDTGLKSDIPSDSSLAAAPHEIMSAIIGIKEYADILDKTGIPESREFFARCITGYQYKAKNTDSDIKNCFISILNSKVIDVDKLDYLLRDAYTTGFDTVRIDYKRLLFSLTVAETTEKRYRIAYYKTAISVIENVVYAHDSERKWIQNHPVTLYEGYILKHIIASLCQKMKQGDKKLFSLETLGIQGEFFDKSNFTISLLCDDDIIFLMKNMCFDGLKELRKEYFDRRTRRHPVWKSEAEYKTYIESMVKSGNFLKRFEQALSETAIYLSKNTESWVIDDALITKLEQEVKDIENAPLDEASKQTQRENKNLILKVVHTLKEFSQAQKIECNFVLLKVSQFNSGFGKPDFTNTSIVFRANQEDKIKTVGEIVSSLQAKEKDKNRDSFFYLFYKRTQSREQLNIEELCKKLFFAVNS